VKQSSARLWAFHIPLPFALPGLNAASARVIAAGYRVSGLVHWHTFAVGTAARRVPVAEGGPAVATERAGPQISAEDGPRGDQVAKRPHVLIGSIILGSLGVLYTNAKRPRT
jgi:hypothetical protein